ncbi:Vhr1p [Sugiyamaella lignohabitans]|uniref:Vhr1p n=1 Tax=Sugiyamaella lignohabitans TaxID=796027 RepID=A0A161HLR8_9ASCO|nr:Vhr1p [Sugiyamaella lignohabitans]ANB14387.1 Vhr1p [Sugiyamaella lignohabitans]
MNTPDSHQKVEHSLKEPDGNASDNDHMVQLGVGITQAIRSRLNFTDDYKWKRFSARRLELIDELELSSRKASEQDEKISLVANRLREEYGFPETTLNDFHRLVRAGIQSVRRNRKRSYLKGTTGPSNPTGNTSSTASGTITPNTSTPTSGHSPILSSDHIHMPQTKQSYTKLTAELASSNSIQDKRVGLQFENISPDRFKFSNQADSDDESSILPLKRPRAVRPSPQNNDRISITSLISPSPPVPTHPLTSDQTVLPPVSSLSLASPGPREDLFILALERLQQFTIKLSSHMPVNSNTEFLGQSVMSTAAAYAVERRLPNHESSETVRSYVLSFTVTSAIVRALGLHSFSLLKITLASCCREYGFDTIIHSLSSFYYEMFNIDPTFDLTKESSYDKMASILATVTSSRAIPTPVLPVNTGLLSAPGSTITSLTSLSGTAYKSQAPVVRPVTLRFGNQKLEFTYSPARVSSPPTVSEVLDNGRNAFSINKEQPLQIENRNRPGKILLTDADVADTFTEARVDIELRVVQRDRPLASSAAADRPKFQELL